MADDILKNIPLPADLPENWTSGQTIAPTGAEVGMDEQHGYNYLMMQVNNAQRALKALAAQREEDLARIKFWASDDPTSPASFIGGTWERIEGKFIMGASDTYPAGSTGGSATHTQTRNEVAGHIHGQRIWTQGSAGSEVMGFEAGKYNVFSASDSAIILNAGSTSENYNPNGAVPMDILNPYYSMYIWRRVA